MDTFNLLADVNVFCIDVPTFPNGIPEAFDALSKLLPTMENRVFYGISYMDKMGKIIYNVAVSSTSANEAERYNCEPFTIKKGEYLAATIMDWRENIPGIGKTFQEMFTDDRVDKNSICVEWYKTDVELMCMAKIK